MLKFDATFILENTEGSVHMFGGHSGSPRNAE